MSGMHNAVRISRDSKHLRAILSLNLCIVKNSTVVAAGIPKDACWPQDCCVKETAIVKDLGRVDCALFQYLWSVQWRVLNMRSQTGFPMKRRSTIVLTAR